MTTQAAARHPQHAHEVAKTIQGLTPAARLAIHPGAGDGIFALGRADTLRMLGHANLTHEAEPSIRFTGRKARLTEMGRHVAQELAAREKRAPKRLTPTMRTVLVQMGGGQNWTHHPWQVFVLRSFKQLRIMGLVAEAAHPVWCKGDCSTHWVITEAGERRAAEIPKHQVGQVSLIWDGQ